MRRTCPVLAAALVFLSACGGETVRTARPAADADAAAPATTASSPASSASGEDARTNSALPDPDAPIPRRAGALARELEATWVARRAAVGTWVRSGDMGRWPPPEDVELLALHEQRIYRFLASRDRLAERVLARLSLRVLREARPNVRAGGALYDHFAPVKELPDFRTRAPEAPDVLLRYFRDAQERFGVDWEVLAAVMLIETRMGRIVSNSSAGAQGPMQFIPSTWAAYGLGGDVHEERDAVMGAANYLRASGAPSDYRRALYSYNPVAAYVTAVSGYARTMRRDPGLFYTYYNWQVFVRTTRGDVRLTGPGL
jgi:transglycosylase-like protein with SLT domain